MNRFLACTVLLASLAGCGPEPAAPQDEDEWVLRPAQLNELHQEPEITVRLLNGGLLRVRVITLGNTCVRKGVTYVLTDSAGKVVAPHDYYYKPDDPDHNCADIGREYLHEVDVPLERERTESIRVRARDLSGRIVEVVLTVPDPE